jgi:hypothetical protein
MDTANSKDPVAKWKREAGWGKERPESAGDSGKQVIHDARQRLACFLAQSPMTSPFVKAAANIFCLTAQVTAQKPLSDAK